VTETTLTDFLLARIAEDEQAALAASPGPWHLNAESTEVIAVDDIQVAEAFALSSPQLRATAEHISRHDPARVLAECDAKRQIIQWQDLEGGGFPRGFVDYMLRQLALPHAGHPDYDQRWRP
jgi:hypothetical protein